MGALFSIPNLITLTNLFCGLCALVSTLYGNFEIACLFVLGSAVADFLDGLVARALNQQGPLGVQLDSLADVVSFGAVPATMLYMLIVRSQLIGDAIPLTLYPEALPAFLVALFAALRLAKFNIDTRQTEGFIGLNTPSATIFVVGLVLMYQYDSFGIGHAIANASLLYLIIAVLCALMIAEIPMFGFKFKQLSWKGNEIRLTFVLLSVLLLLFLREAALPIIIFFYVGINTVQSYLTR